MRFNPALTAALFSSTAMFIAPAQADDMLVNALKRVSELEAKNIALELNHRRLEEGYKTLEERNRQLEKTNKARETTIIKQEIKPDQKKALNATKSNTTPPQMVANHKPDIVELNRIAFEGAYIGINGGYGGGVVNTVTDNYYWTTNSNSIRFGGPEVGKSNDFVRAGGGLVGGQLGYNYLFKNNLMAGAELDFDWTDIGSQGNNSVTGFLPPKGAFINSSSRIGLKWLSTERIRFGYLVGSFMPYLTGGLAIAQSAYRESGYGLISDTSIYTNAVQGGTSKVGVGWSAGAGIEYSLLNNLSLKTEYLYTQTPGIKIHNSTELSFSNISGKIGTFADGSTANLDLHQVRVGLNYHPHFFDNPAPAVISKY